MELLIIAALLSTVVTTSSANEPLDLSPEEWVAVSRCRLQCIEKFLISTGYALSENNCVSDAYGCFDCWKTCQNVLTKPSQHGSTCENAKTNDATECTPGCNAACDSLDSLDKRFYASSSSALIAPPEIEFYNTTLFNMTYKDIDMSTGNYVSVTLYRLNEAMQWQQLISTFQQPIPIYGSFYKYPSLQLRIITITSKGVIGDYTLNIYELASKVTNPPTTTTTTSTAAIHTSTPKPILIDHQNTATTRYQPTTPSQPHQTTTQTLSEYERMFNHFFRKELILDNSQDAIPDNTIETNAVSNTGLYVVVVAVCVLVLVIAIVGIVILRSNNQLAKSLSQRARSFRSSFHRSVRRSVRGIRREHARAQYDVEMASLRDASTPKEHPESPNGNDDSELNTSEMRPMVVPLLCVSTPNLHTVNKLDISSIDLRKLHTMSLSTLPKPTSSATTSPNTSTVECSNEDTVPETTENTTDSIEIIDNVSDC